ncbi:hypothetical protein AVEN_220728-1 [Araneus ventricosus]|uniref:Uncharacterized protein n=1 Tax=Araneus ventricosus TaxID=182803 RepID=A0A4Y2VUP5_ARAVE|nr:hypothetical protein AVEN_220728-1 [Araneus ventricosus]
MSLGILTCECRRSLKRLIHRRSILEFLEHGKEKPITNRQGRKPMKFGVNDWKWWNSNELKIQNNLGPPCEGSGKTKDLPTLGPRVEARNETRNPLCWGRGVWCGKNSATLNLVSKQTLEHP